MLNKKEFSSMRDELERFDKKREDIIQDSRKILKASKQLIYAVHRGDLKKAELLIKDIVKKKAVIKMIVGTEKKLDEVGILNAAVQEYVEAASYFGFVKNRKIPAKDQLGVDTENYLMGLCDLTGELARKAVMAAIEKDIKTVEIIHGLVDEIFSEFLGFDFRNGELRKKSDAIKWNLKKIEEVLYDLKTK